MWLNSTSLEIKYIDFTRQVDNTAERGARMKSVGVISANYLALFQHEERLVELAQDSVERPGSYEQLIQYFAEYNQGSSVPVSLEMKANSVGSMYDLFKSQGLYLLNDWNVVVKRLITTLHSIKTKNKV